MRHKQPYASRDQKPGRRRGYPAEDVSENREVSVFKIEHTEREPARPRDDGEARDRRDRSDTAAHFRPNADSDADDVRPGHELAEADDVGEFPVADPALVFHRNPRRPDNSPTETAERDDQEL